MEVATISRTANATQAAENAANAARAMIARRMRPKWRNAVASEGETSRDRDDDDLAMAPHAKRAKKRPHWWHHVRKKRKTTSSRAMTMLTLMTSTTMTSLPSWASVQWGTMALTAPLAFN